MLSVKENRRSRSKSPGGRDTRERSRSRDTRAKSPPRKEHKKSSKKYESESSSESEDDRRYKEKRSSKKYYESESEDDRRKKYSSKKRSDSDSDEDDRRRKSKGKKHHDESDDDRKKKEHRSSRRRGDSESESERRREKNKKGNKKGESESSGSEDINISIHRKSGGRKDKKDEREKGVPTAPYPPPAAPYGYPPGPGYPPDPRNGYQDTRHASYDGRADPRYAPPGAYLPGQPVVPDAYRAHSVSGPPGRYAEAERYQYASVDPNIKYKTSEQPQIVQAANGKQYIKTYQNGQPQFVEVKPEKVGLRDREDKKYHEDKHEKRERKDRDDKYGSPPDKEMSRRLSSLAVGGGLGAGLGAGLGLARHGSHDGGKPPASPLLEAYKGTYQSISPMPGALVLANHKNDSDISDFDMSESSADDSDTKTDLQRKIRHLEKEKARHEKERVREVEMASTANRTRHASDTSIMVVSPSSAKKKVSFYDPIPDAKKIAAALQGTHSPPNTRVLLHILPDLTSDEILILRAEYKNHAKVAGQGINMTKHIKLRVPGNIGKAVYATSLGRWESEAHWANSWYQGGASRRELLIESLMGRSNSDITEIKRCFKDKKYDDSLEKSIKSELRADKFRTALLLQLEERRMSENELLDIADINRDVSDLYRALTAPGGETAMIQIIVVRSDKHIREVLKLFERKYQMNFPREMIAKSKNLVGETLAHILNGALNRAMRDAILLHQAISETAPGKERAELLISRTCRLHWEPKHLEKVKFEYERRYKVPVAVAIKRDVVDLVKTEEARLWGEFCIALVRSSAD